MFSPRQGTSKEGMSHEDPPLVGLTPSEVRLPEFTKRRPHHSDSLILRVLSTLDELEELEELDEVACGAAGADEDIEDATELAV